MSQPVLSALLDHLRHASSQRLTFEEFMAWVLYQPEFGYYSGGQVDIGIRGDFVTAIALGQDFGELLTRQFVEMWQRLGEPDQFDLLELGAGTGAFAKTVFEYAAKVYPDFYQALRYQIIEESAALQHRQQGLLSPWQDTQKVTWLTWSDIAPNSITGCCFSNEFFDALPVHRVGIQGGRIKGAVY